jgi:transposase
MKTFRPYQPDQLLLLPPSIQEWLPEGHLARSVSEVVDELAWRPSKSATTRSGAARRTTRG